MLATRICLSFNLAMLFRSDCWRKIERRAWASQHLERAMPILTCWVAQTCMYKQCWSQTCWNARKERLTRTAEGPFAGPLGERMDWWMKSWTINHGSSNRWQKWSTWGCQAVEFEGSDGKLSRFCQRDDSPSHVGNELVGVLVIILPMFHTEWAAKGLKTAGVWQKDFTSINHGIWKGSIKWISSWITETLMPASCEWIVPQLEQGRVFKASTFLGVRRLRGGCGSSSLLTNQAFGLYDWALTKFLYYWVYIPLRFAGAGRNQPYQQLPISPLGEYWLWVACSQFIDDFAQYCLYYDRQTGPRISGKWPFVVKLR